MEDIGLADPRALRIALDATETYERLGSPEGELSLAQATLYLACAPKSNAAYLAYNKARSFIGSNPSHRVPEHLRNARTKLMKELGTDMSIDAQTIRKLCRRGIIFRKHAGGNFTNRRARIGRKISEKLAICANWTGRRRNTVDSYTYQNPRRHDFWSCMLDTQLLRTIWKTSPGFLPKAAILFGAEFKLLEANAKRSDFAPGTASAA